MRMCWKMSGLNIRPWINYGCRRENSMLGKLGDFLCLTWLLMALLTFLASSVDAEVMGDCLHWGPNIISLILIGSIFIVAFFYIEHILWQLRLFVRWDWRWLLLLSLLPTARTNHHSQPLFHSTHVTLEEITLFAQWPFVWIASRSKWSLSTLVIRNKISIRACRNLIWLYVACFWSGFTPNVARLESIRTETISHFRPCEFVKPSQSPRTFNAIFQKHFCSHDVNAMWAVPLFFATSCDYSLPYKLL